MKRFGLFILVSIFTFGCGTDKRSKKSFKTSFRVCDSLYMELYTVYGSGALGGDLLSGYLTDSMQFRKYLGTFDDAQGAIAVNCNNDSIIVKELVIDGMIRTVKQTRFFSRKVLKGEGRFD